ncbi:uncharacterized protein Dvar_84750 [Desulfosarcina variabilis str. Montpellier]
MRVVNLFIFHRLKINTLGFRRMKKQRLCFLLVCQNTISDIHKYHIWYLNRLYPCVKKKNKAKRLL